MKRRGSPRTAVVWLGVVVGLVAVGGNAKADFTCGTQYERLLTSWAPASG